MEQRYNKHYKNETVKVLAKKWVHSCRNLSVWKAFLLPRNYTKKKKKKIIIFYHQNFFKALIIHHTLAKSKEHNVGVNFCNSDRRELIVPSHVKSSQKLRKTIKATTRCLLRWAGDVHRLLAEQEKRTAPGRTDRCSIRQQKRKLKLRWAVCAPGARGGLATAHAVRLHGGGLRSLPKITKTLAL